MSKAPPVTSDPAIDAAALRAALSGFATGITIVTCRDATGAPMGLTINSFNALSLDPPLVLWSLRLASPRLAAFDAASHFAVNVLAESQVDLSRRFASSRAARFDDECWRPGAGGVPLLVGSAAHFTCVTTSRQDQGDHRLYIGRVLAASSQPVQPLLFHGGRYQRLGEIL